MGDGTSEDLSQLPDAYEKWRASAVGRITDALERQLILDLIGDVAGLAVLDVGCGDGELAVELSCRGATVTGIDASPSMIEAARVRAERQGAKVVFELATASSLPFRSDKFDKVTAVTVLCFVEDAGLVLQEIARILKPGGNVIIGELGKWSLWAAERRVRGWVGSSLWRRAQFRTGRKLCALASEAGLDVNALRGAVYYPRCTLAARLLGSYDPFFDRLTTVGAAFLALAATKPIR